MSKRAARKRLEELEKLMEDGVQDFGRVLLKDLARLNDEDPPFCNVTFVVGKKGKEKEFHSVKAILALQSEMFAGMLFGNMAEALEEHPTLTFPDFDPDIFRIFLNFMHTGKLDIGDNPAKSEEIMQELMTMADHFDVRHLFGALYSFQQNEYTDENVMTFIHLGERFRDDVLIEDATGYVMRHAERFFEDQKWVNDLPEQRLCEFLGRDDCRAKELTLFNAVVAWGEHKIAESKEDSSLKTVIKGPMSNIRLGLIPAAVLVEELAANEIIDSDMLIKALAYQADRKHFGKLYELGRRKGVIHGSKMTLSREEVMSQRAKRLCGSPYGSTHDGGATAVAGKIFAHYGNDGSMGNRLHVIDTETSDMSVIDLPFGTHGSYPLNDGVQYVYVYEDSDNAHGSGFGRVDIDSLEFERLTDAPSQHCRFSCGCFQDGRVWKLISGNQLVSYDPDTDTWARHVSTSSNGHLLADPLDEDIIWILEQGGSLRQYSIAGDSLSNISSRPGGFNLGANYPSVIVARTGDEKSDDDGILLMSFSSSSWNMYDSTTGTWDAISWENIGEGGHVCADGSVRRIFLQTNNSNTWNVIDYDEI